MVSAAEMAGAKETVVDPHKKKSMHHHESFKVEAPYENVLSVLTT
jgi:hypothetical protein